MITKKQDWLYWREWGAVRKVDPAADRHALHAQALGADKSHKDFSNADLDKVLGVFRAISDASNLNAQLRQAGQERFRLKFSIGKLAPASYTAAICQDRFGTRDLDELTIEQLLQVRITLSARASARRARKAAPVLSDGNPF